jgi:hypothetical protein
VERAPAEAWTRTTAPAHAGSAAPEVSALPSAFSLSGRLALVTGAGSVHGIGLATA